jgi:hypothetical protein
MRNSAVLSQLQVPPIVLFRKLQFIDSCLQYFKPLLPLGTANDFSYFWSQDVKGCDCFAISVLTHIEGLDVFGIVVEYNRLVEDMITQITFVLRCQVNSPKDLVLELNSLLDALNKALFTLRRMSMA